MGLRDRGLEIKSPEQVDLMRRAGLVVGETLELLRSSVRAGISTGELDAIAEDNIRSSGAVPSFKGYHGFPGSICASVNDEVVHGKGSLLRKMPGDRWQQLANLRAYLGFMWAHPGKQLLFMGVELGQESEWAEARELDWWLLDHPEHRGVHSLVRDLNSTYADSAALWARDSSPEGFMWLDGNDAGRNTFSFVRRAPGEPDLVCVSNFSAVPYHGYRLALPATGSSLATPSAAAALPSAPPVLGEETAAEAFARELARDPVGVVIGNEIHRPDGAVFVAVDAGTLSLSQCTSGRWCMWDETNYQGSFSYRTGSGVTYLLSGTVHSVFNNRGAAARLFSNTSATSTCYVAGAKSASVSASYYTAEKVRLLAGGC